MILGAGDLNRITTEYSDYDKLLLWSVLIASQAVSAHIEANRHKKGLTKKES